MSKLKNRPFKLGTYQLGFQWVDLWVDPTNRDGAFEFHPDRKSFCTVTVGIRSDGYAEVLGTLMHELLEATACDLGARYKRSGMFTESSDCYYFQMNHNDFTELCARAAYFISMCQVDLMTVHKRYNKNAIP